MKQGGHISMDAIAPHDPRQTHVVSFWDACAIPDT